MKMPCVLAFPLEDAVKKLVDAGFLTEVGILFPPRESETEIDMGAVRKYVVRQRLLPGNRIHLTVVYRHRKGVRLMLKIDKEACIGCGTCASVCPVGAVKEVDGKYEIDETCVECGACAANCPVSCIE